MNSIRIFYSLFILMMGTLGTQAQITIHPLKSNTALLKMEQEKEARMTADMAKAFGIIPESAEFRIGAVQCVNNIDNVYEDGSTVYVRSEDSVKICVVTTFYPDINCLNCGTLQLGSASLNGSCFTYRADAGIDADKETLQIEQCDSTGACITVNIDIAIRRRGQRFIEPTLVLNSDEDTILCASNLNLPGDIEQSNFLSQDPRIGRVRNYIQEDECFGYFANRFAEPDTINFEVCDVNCVCDTFLFPVRIVGDTIGIPFMDDFSYKGPYPDPAKWLDDDVFINSTMAFQPPSIGVATFDGLRESGRAYGEGEGLSDKLTSAYFDLSNVGTETYLSFYVEPKGFAFPPGLDDSLTVEFKNDMGEWILVDAINGLGSVPINSTPPFQFYSYKVDDPQYLFNGFQFRFVRYGDREGIDNVFHLDYVRLSNLDVPDGNFKDLAFTALPSFLLEDYTAMPWSHFMGHENEELANSIEINLFNQHFEFINAEPARLEVKELTTETVVLQDPAILEASQRTIQAQTRAKYDNPKDFSALAGIFPMEDSLIFQLKYIMELDSSKEANPTSFPLVKLNNTVRRNTDFTNYFARDDGSAEGAVSIGVGNMIAMRFTANVADTLRAVQFHFPHFKPVDANSILFNIKIFVGNLDDSPEFEANFQRLYFADSSFDTLQGFTTFPLKDFNGDLNPLAIPAGDFYVAWQQNSPVPQNGLLVGLDKNTDKGNGHQFYWDLTEWDMITTAQYPGSVMVRAVVGENTPPSTESLPATEPNVNELGIKIFPNPASNLLYIKLAEGFYEDHQISIFDAAGRLVARQMLAEEIDLRSFPNGLYYVKIRDMENGLQQTEKLLINRY